MMPASACREEPCRPAKAPTVERFDFFAIIVLGESITAMVQNLAGHHHLIWLANDTAESGNPALTLKVCGVRMWS